MNPNPAAEFVSILRECIEKKDLTRVVLSKYKGTGSTLRKVSIRPVTIKDNPCFSFVHHHETNDITENVPVERTAEMISRMLRDFGAVNMVGGGEEVQLLLSRKGKAVLVRRHAVCGGEASLEHDREKKRFVDAKKPFLHELGITDKNGHVLPSMTAKWRQINVFAEIFQRSFAATPLAGGKQVNVVDFGCGKGYLTFAIHDFLVGAGVAPSVTGIEIRGDLVALCNRAVQKLALGGLSFIRGDVSSVLPTKPDILVALHACDTATDEAIYKGIDAGAALIMCAPCCHKELRPQIHKPAVLEPVLRFGVHLGDEAEMVTDSIRSLLLEANGYDVQLFEFISLEHTGKNKMILALKNASSPAARHASAYGKLSALKEFYGIKSQALEVLLAQRPQATA